MSVISLVKQGGGLRKHPTFFAVQINICGLIIDLGYVKVK